MICIILLSEYMSIMAFTSLNKFIIDKYGLCISSYGHSRSFPLTPTKVDYCKKQPFSTHVFKSLNSTKIVRKPPFPLFIVNLIRRNSVSPCRWSPRPEVVPSSPCPFLAFFWKRNNEGPRKCQSNTVIISPKITNDPCRGNVYIDLNGSVMRSLLWKPVWDYQQFSICESWPFWGGCQITPS